LRPATAADAATLHAVFISPGVRRFMFDDRIVPREQTEEIVERSTALFAERGFGLWLARAAAPAAAEDARAIVGFGAFWHFREPPDLELLYGVADAYLGRGFGLEIARGVVEYGFTTLRMPVIRASADAGHAASQRLLDRLGFTLARRDTVNGLDTLFYARENPRVSGTGHSSAANGLDVS
jgi:ribosomal-protein-alanine N-acetyltransferase